MVAKDLKSMKSMKSMKNIKTIVYITDSVLSQDIAEPCRKILEKNSLYCPIISVSQKPLNFGFNICVGDIGLSGVSIYTQLLAGLKHVKTKWVMVAEHDCLYSEEHVAWIPPDPSLFWYNDNVWFLQYKNSNHPEYDGMFSHTRRRRVQSQLVCEKDILLKATNELLAILKDEQWFAMCPTGRIGEPGTASYPKTMRLASRKELQHLKSAIKDYITEYQAVDFKTRVPNIDIRHGQNFTGQRRGNHRRFFLKPWGAIEDIFGH